MKIVITTFEGTPEEYRQYRAIEGAAVERGAAPLPAAGVDADYGAFVQRVLKRIPIPPGQRELYRALADAGDDFLASPELASRLGRTDREMSGVLGALGKRINGTPGAAQIAEQLNEQGDTFAKDYPVVLLFETRLFDDGVYRYRLRPELRRILKEERVIES